MSRIQVKTTTVRVGETFTVWLSKSRKARVTYDSDEIDYFFVIDGCLRYYLLPVAVVGGLHQIHLSAYSGYRVDGQDRRGLADSSAMSPQANGLHPPPDQT